MNIFKVISAHTTYPNTKESDLLPEVMHTVTVQYEDGSTGEIKVMAACPLTAMDKIKKRNY